jgi:hypothetical protein
MTCVVVGCLTDRSTDEGERAERMDSMPEVQSLMQVKEGVKCVQPAHPFATTAATRPSHPLQERSRSVQVLPHTRHARLPGSAQRPRGANCQHEPFLFRHRQRPAAQAAQGVDPHNPVPEITDNWPHTAGVLRAPLPCLLPGALQLLRQASRYIHHRRRTPPRPHLA